jgi:hypothetical protein
MTDEEWRVRHNICWHCRQLKPVVVIRGWHKCKECLEDIDRKYWMLMNVEGDDG